MWARINMALSRQLSQTSKLQRLFVYSCMLTTGFVVLFLSSDHDSRRDDRKFQSYGIDMLLARDYPIWRGKWKPADLAGNISDDARKPMCPLHSPDLGIGVPLNITTVTYDEVRSLYPMMQRGGYYSPRECRPHNRTAIVIPYRDRENNLMVLLRNLIPFLVLQNAEFRLFVLEQTQEEQFNKGVLVNLGYLEAKKLYNFTCFMFHDTDWLPTDFRNVYTCSQHPKHLLVTRPELRHYGPMYSKAFGGAVTFTRRMFEAVNGFSNLYYGWGIEDDDLRRRYTLKKIPVERNDWVIGTYIGIEHKQQKRNKKRHEVFKKTKEHPETDGLTSVKKSVKKVKISHRELFTHILVKVAPPPKQLY